MNIFATFAGLAALLQIVIATSPAACTQKCCYNQMLNFDEIEGAVPLAGNFVPQIFQNKGIYITGAAIAKNAGGGGIGPPSNYIYTGATTDTAGAVLKVIYPESDLDSFFVQRLGLACSFAVNVATVAKLRCNFTLTAYGGSTDSSKKGAQSLVYDTVGLSTNTELQFLTSNPANFPGGLDWQRVNITTDYKVKLLDAAGLPVGDFIDLGAAGVVAKPFTFIDAIRMQVTPKVCVTCASP